MRGAGVLGYAGRMSRVDELRRTIDAELRRAAEGGYDERQAGLGAAGGAAQELARCLTRGEARAARPAFLQVVEIVEVGGCTPQCCNAWWVRSQILRGKFEVLRAWARCDPNVAEEIGYERVELLLAPTSTRIALATAELFALSPAGSGLHLPSVLEALKRHPRWQVRWALVRALGRANLRGESPKRVIKALERASKSSNDEIARAGRKALAAVMRRKTAASAARSA